MNFSFHTAINFTSKQDGKSGSAAQLFSVSGFNQSTMAARPARSFLTFGRFISCSCLGLAKLRHCCLLARLSSSDPLTLLFFCSGLTSKRHCRLLARLSSSDPLTLSFFRSGLASKQHCCLLARLSLSNPQTLLFFCSGWQANNNVVCLPTCPRPTLKPFRFFGLASKQHCCLLARLSLSDPLTLLFFVGVRQANNIVVCLPACPCPTLKPFCFLFGLTSKRHCCLLARLSLSDPQTLLFFCSG